MDKLKIDQLYKEACAFLEKKLLKDAFERIEVLIAESGLGELRNRLEQYQTTYKFMLQYTVQGTDDPEQERIYYGLLESAFELLDEVVQALLLRYDSGMVYSTKRSVENISDSQLNDVLKKIDQYYIAAEVDDAVGQMNQTAASARLEHLDHMSLLYNFFWLSDQFKVKQISALNRFWNFDNGNVNDKCLMVSAVGMSLLRCFDVAKFEKLFDFCDSAEAEVRQRAIVGLLLALYKYDRRLSFFPVVNARLKILNEDKLFLRSMETIVIQLIKSKETEKITRKFQEEILPEVSKISPNLREKMDLDNLLSENAFEDKNPEWQEILDEVPGLTKRMEEFSNLQMEGADVFLSTFAMLKSFPFFNRFQNWFIPFTETHPEISHILADEFNAKFVKSLLKSRFLCNSDKYSFVMSIQQIPSSLKEMMSNSLEAEFGQMEEDEKDTQLINPESNNKFISNQYIQDLYRLFKLHPNKNDFEDVFEWKLDFHNKSFFYALAEDKKVLRSIGEYYFIKNYFDEALEVFQILLKDKPDDLELYQKAGYSCQKKGNYKKALEYYLKAELINSGKHWTLKKIALCYRQLKKPEKALEYYRHSELINPDNLSTQVSIGHCFVEMKDFQQALDNYFKVEYLAPENTKVWRPIAWCSLETGKLKQADKYYQRIMTKGAGEHDLMNAGHAKWCLGDRKGALQFYKESVAANGGDINKFLNTFNEDKAVLLKNGVSENEIPILLDRLRYDLDT